MGFSEGTFRDAPRDSSGFRLIGRQMVVTIADQA
jgi:hypothetical protein